jgi:hypothetical protein
MERRLVLKNIGKAFGFAVATPTIISILESCGSVDTASWTPAYFSADEASFLTKAVDVLLPKTDTPSASEVNVHVFIDKLIAETYNADAKARVRSGFDAFTSAILSISGAESVAKVTEAQLEQAFTALYGERTDAIASEAYSFAGQFRGMVIDAYKSSEYVGENVLAYLPVPGEYIACDDLDTLTGGVAWAE